MPNIKPVTELKNYDAVLKEVTYGSPVYLTQNGKGDFAIVNMRELDELFAMKKLFSALEKGEKSAREKGWIPFDEARKLLEV